MVASPYYYTPCPAAVSGPTRNHYHHHHHHHHEHHSRAPSGKKHAAAIHHSTNQNIHPSNHTYSSTKSISPVKPIFKPCLPKDRTDIRVCLYQRLKDGSLLARSLGRSSLPRFRSGTGKTRISYEPYDFQVPYSENRDSNENIGIAFKAPTAGSSRSSSSRYFTWRAYATVRESRWSKLLPSKSSPRTVFAEVRVDPAIMHTSYGKFLQNDNRVLSNALAISIELGVLITIVSADETANSYPGSSLLARTVIQHRNAIAPEEYLQYWSKVLAGNDYEYGYGGYASPMTADSVLYIGTSNDGTSDLLYTYPKPRSTC
ncbi:hypothetical protein EV360DRAFT_86421 [Lentinula raphanica]|nr:hypothetical protein EV360DRAFT_86421 [Lentinula raphanica]